ncbi:hypothetical protein [Paenibacillus thiaminolyticus]|uniref:hypothetical protein n=1 Tax=Paenibacillus thiaminolyticus TaxID=49283 RepID=UPI0011C45BF8|nr:hypothetical protein [Paenibacillus thiaminolyticus]
MPQPTCRKRRAAVGTRCFCGAGIDGTAARAYDRGRQRLAACGAHGSGSDGPGWGTLTGSKAVG